MKHYDNTPEYHNHAMCVISLRNETNVYSNEMSEANGTMRLWDTIFHAVLNSGTHIVIYVLRKGHYLIIGRRTVDYLFFGDLLNFHWMWKRR